MEVSRHVVEEVDCSFAPCVQNADGLVHAVGLVDDSDALSVEA